MSMPEGKPSSTGRKFLSKGGSKSGANRTLTLISHVKDLQNGDPQEAAKQLLMQAAKKKMTSALVNTILANSWLILIVLAVVLVVVYLAMVINNVLVKPLSQSDIPPSIRIETEDFMGRYQDSLTDLERRELEKNSVELSHGLIQSIALFTSEEPELLIDLWKPQNLVFEEMEITYSTIVMKEEKNDVTGEIEYRWETKVTTNPITVLKSVDTYNGHHEFIYEYVSRTEGDTTITEPKVVRDDWDQDYSKFFKFLSNHGLRSKEDRLILYRQAMELDPSFFDPDADALLMQLISSKTGNGRSGNKDVVLILKDEEIIAAIREAIAIAGVDEATWLEDMKQLVMRESGGNANAWNPQSVWYSAKWGYQNATGLCQLMPPTFLAHKTPGYDDIWNPVHNLLASIHYIQGKYGHVNNIKGLYDADYPGY